MRPSRTIARTPPQATQRETAPARLAARTSPAAVAAALAKAAEFRRMRYGSQPSRFAPAACMPQPQRIPNSPSLSKPLAAQDAAKTSAAITPGGQLSAMTAAVRAQFAASAPALENLVRKLAHNLVSQQAVTATQPATAGLGFEQALAHEAATGRRILIIAGVFFFGWAAFVPLKGAVIVPGSLVLRSSIKKIQHPAGGVVSAIQIHNGSKVKPGDELVRLEEITARANLQVIARQLDEIHLRMARLNAERESASEPRWPTNFGAALDEAEASRRLASERDLFAARNRARHDQENLFKSRIDQLEKQIAGLEAQLTSNDRQMAITVGEIEDIEKLIKEKLVTIDRLTALQREKARLEGVHGQLSSQIAETYNKITETRLQAIQAEEGFRSEVMRDLRESEGKEGELMERKLAADDQLKRTVIRAPNAGTVQELAVHTVGGVVSPGEVMMTLVPDGDQLEIDARLSPDKIDQVSAGQKAHVRFSAFNARTTPELEGIVTVVSGDVVQDSKGGGYYDVRVSLSATEVQRLGALQLVPGMPAEVFLETGSRTMLSYLFKPLTDQLSRMFRER